MRVGLVLVAMCAVAHAQQLVCEPCQRGDDRLSQLPGKGAVLQARKADILGLAIRGPEITQQQGQTIDGIAHELNVSGDLDALRQLDEPKLIEISAALCGVPGGDCVDRMQQSIACLLGRCQVIVEHHNKEMMLLQPGCDSVAAQAGGSKTGLGFEYASGWQDDASPVDHRAWSLGFEMRAYVAKQFSLVARIDRSTGRDAAIDTDGDHRDDVGTGPVTRLSTLAGPSYVFAIGHDDDIVRFAQLDLLAGYQWTLSKDSEGGLVTGADLSYQLAVARVGLRYTQGFGDAADARAVLGHIGFLVGASPHVEYGKGCGRDEERSPSRLALALDIPLFGYGLSKQLDYIVPSFGIESAYYVSSYFDVIVRGDLLVVPGTDRDRTIYHSLLAGGRIDLGGHTGKGQRSGFFATLATGYAWAAVTTPTTAGSGPVVDASIGWGAQGNDGMAYLRIHGRFGVTPDNYDARAIFLSGGMELRLDRKRWNDRI
jgi:hypothetical protein